MNEHGDLIPLAEALDEDLVVESPEPEHAQHPRTFVLSANGERYKNTWPKRRKARKAQRQARRGNR